jgi:GDPmannose 4,6-dehydratase
MMLQMEKADDYVIATGITRSLAYFIARAFAWFGLDWKAYVRFDHLLRRPSDIAISQADPSKAVIQLGWQARHSVDAVIDLMCVEAARIEGLSGGALIVGPRS